MFVKTNPTPFTECILKNNSNYCTRFDPTFESNVGSKQFESNQPCHLHRRASSLEVCWMKSIYIN